jgi:N-acetylmuramic acid 6-phosphate etherase
MAEALADGNRVFFLGAGTSGRLGVLEAAECPPTFGTRPAQIQAFMAGGRGAVARAREGAEDRGAEAVAALRKRKLVAGDLVVGISASSVTPFVRRGLAYARRRRARTVLLTCSPGGRGLAELVISTPVGPEILAGSTRLKAATATKLVLNSLSLLAMVRLGKVYGPYMVDLRAGSAKLRARARRMVAGLGKVSLATASRLLRASGGEVKTAIASARLGISARQARRELGRYSGNLRDLLEARRRGKRPARAGRTR